MMELLIEPMFTIPIYRILLNGLSDEMNLELFLRGELENNPNKEKYDNEVEQTYPDLHLKKEMQPLCDNIFKAVELKNITSVGYYIGGMKEKYLKLSEII